ncbi:MAG: hypothetical protein ABMB14_26105, partial [Myxococcota bacterium]
MHDLARFRPLFPVTDRLVYLNHAGMCPVATPVIDAVTASVRHQAEYGLARIGELEAGIDRVRAASA